VQTNHLDALTAVLLNLYTTTISKIGCNLASLNCSSGLAGESSVPAGYFKDRQSNIRGIFEVKQGTDIPAEALRQSAVEASNVGLMQLKLGVHVDDIMVPVVGSNGHMMQFGAVIMLRPSFPSFFIISEVLDMTNDASLREAAKLLCCDTRGNQFGTWSVNSDKEPLEGRDVVGPCTISFEATDSFLCVHRKYSVQLI
jgi:hypothetical protein